MIVLLAIAALAAAATFYCYNLAFLSHPKRRNTLPAPTEDPLMQELMEEIRVSPFEKVHTTAFDGLTLNGRYYHHRDGAPLHIQFHGYRGSIERDICGGLRIAKDLGYNTIIIEQRAHGESLGRSITFGVKERHDCLSWINYAKERFGEETPMFVSGISMGAATVLMAAGLPLPSCVKAIMADCPYSSPEAIISKVCRDDMHLPPALCMPFIRLAARVLGGFDLREASATEAVRRAKVPILIIHGEKDKFVPVYMSREIESACAGDCKLVLFPGADHGMAYISNPEEYMRVLREFLVPLIPQN